MNLIQTDSMDKTLIIAEAGVNHNGSLKTAKELIDVASDAGADYVKFQTFKAETLVTKKAEKAVYQKNLTEKNESQYEMIKKLELDLNAHKKLIEHCSEKKIKFLSTAFDNDSLNLLNKLNVPLFKVPSGEITNLPYLRYVASLGKPVVMSTGMSEMYEIEKAINILLDSKLRKRNISLLHCNTEYPTPIDDVNLNAMIKMRDKFNINVGYSDHTLGIEVPIAAVAMGASIIEKHFTLDRAQSGPDHVASLEPKELKLMVQGIRNVERAFGSENKKPSQSEIKNIVVARKSIVAKKQIKKGEKLSEDNLTVKRPGSGISPMKWDKIIGNYAKKNYDIDELIQ